MNELVNRKKMMRMTWDFPITYGRAVPAFTKLPGSNHTMFFSKGVAPSVEAFDKLMNSMVAEFLKKSRILAGDVETHVSTFLCCTLWKDWLLLKYFLR